MLPDWNISFRTLLDAAPDGIVLCDQAGTLVLLNAEAERMFGYAHDDAGLPGSRASREEVANAALVVIVVSR